MNAPRLNKWGGDATAVVDVLAGVLAAARTAPVPQAVGGAPREPSPAPASPPTSRWSRSPSVVERRTLQGIMVLPPEGPAVVLTGMAAAVWAAVTGSVDTDELVAGLSRSDATAAEVVAALADLRAMGALRELR